MPLVGVAEAEAPGEIDPTTGTAEELAMLFPELGVVSAEDVVLWREARGALPDRDTLVDDLGISPDVAAAMVAYAKWVGASNRASGEHAVGTVVDDEAPPAREDVADPRDVESLDDGHRGHDARAPEVEAPPPQASVRPRATPPPLPPDVEAPPVENVAPPPAPVKARKTFPVSMVMFTLLFTLNVAAIVGLLLTRRDERRDVAPIGSISTGLATLSADHEGTRAELDRAKAKLLQQDERLAEVARATAENAARQQAAERAAQAREAREARAARELAAIAGRVSTLEQRARDGAVTMTLQEALPLIDAVGGTKAPAAPASVASTHGPPRSLHTH